MNRSGGFAVGSCIVRQPPRPCRAKFLLSHLMTFCECIMYKFSVLIAAALFCLVSLGQTAVAGQVNAFVYHRFDETKYPSTNISSAVFAEQLACLQRQNYTVLSIGEVVRRLRSGENLPAKGAVLTVDDAYSSFADVAMPIVRQYGFPISLFVNTDAVGSRGYLDWA
ncbi:MAG: polysaccharide deacetylase family protein, partial [Desulfuromonadaceae bacterium]|nr:polysaccharide deacetylase family protein [Desulfuromonadaceae bacterium]